VHTLSGDRRGSLLSVIDRTITGAGARLLASQLNAPLTDAARINERLDAVTFFVTAPPARERLRTAFSSCPDIERALSRLSLGRGGPRDLACMRDALAQVPSLRAAVMELPASLLPPSPLVARQLKALGEHETLVSRLSRALAPELPLLARDGGFIAPGYDAALDEFLALRDESRKLIAGLQAGYAELSGIPALKIRHNNILGYYIETSGKPGEKLMEDARAGGPCSIFIHRQSMANAMRFTTVALSELEDKIRSAADKALALELKLFADLVGEVLAHRTEIAAAAAAIAGLDVATALAQLAADEGHVRPTIDDGAAFHIEGGRHPVVEAVLKRQGASFVANDCVLGNAAKTNAKKNGRLWLITGPNMAGKSTFLRQNALIALMAQMGAYVPATSAHIGIIDRLFSRVGAADDLARGRSTFMVEMVETAAILNQATAKSFVILDEIGRGTATFDGLSIAWASLEHLHDVNTCRALFATHYHELTALAARLPELAPHTMRVKEWQGDVIFLHEVAAGAADRSYGIHVGRLAGLPPAVIARAEQVLAILEKDQQVGGAARLADDLPLFASLPKVSSGGIAKPAGPSPVDTALADVSPDSLSPREALDILYRLKALAAEKS
jgi:DNA mismatch repair protein MutS